MDCAPQAYSIQVKNGQRPLQLNVCETDLWSSSAMLPDVRAPLPTHIHFSHSLDDDAQTKVVIIMTVCLCSAGAIDGKHVQIECPKLSGSLYRNYKSTFSSVLMAVADANYCFTYIDVGAYGRENDARIFSSSVFGQRLARDELHLPTAREGELEYVFVGDEAFQLQYRVLRPYPGSRPGGAEDDYHRRLVYNYRLCRARRIVENTFGILVSRWRILRQPIKAKIETVDAVVKATCVLHNYLRRRDGTSSDRRYIGDGDVDFEDSGHLTRGAWRHEGNDSCFRNIGRLGSNNSTRRASELRERYAAYFVSPEGSVPWQDAVVRRGRLV